MDHTELKRRKATRNASPEYPDSHEIRKDRRGFLRLLGAALLGTAAAGLTKGATATPREDIPLSEAITKDLPDFQLSGGDQPTPEVELPPSELLLTKPGEKDPEDPDTPPEPDPAEVPMPGEPPAVPDQPEFHLEGDVAEPPAEPVKE